MAQFKITVTVNPLITGVPVQIWKWNYLTEEWWFVTNLIEMSPGLFTGAAVWPDAVLQVVIPELVFNGVTYEEWVSYSFSGSTTQDHVFDAVLVRAPATIYDSTYRGIDIYVWMPEGYPYTAYFNNLWHTEETLALIQTTIDVFLASEPATASLLPIAGLALLAFAVLRK